LAYFLAFCHRKGQVVLTSLLLKQKPQQPTLATSNAMQCSTAATAVQLAHGAAWETDRDAG